MRNESKLLAQTDIDADGLYWFFLWKNLPAKQRKDYLTPRAIEKNLSALFKSLEQNPLKRLALHKQLLSKRYSITQAEWLSALLILEDFAVDTQRIKVNIDSYLSYDVNFQNILAHMHETLMEDMEFKTTGFKLNSLWPNKKLVLEILYSYFEFHFVQRYRLYEPWQNNYSLTRLNIFVKYFSGFSNSKFSLESIVSNAQLLLTGGASQVNSIKKEYVCKQEATEQAIAFLYRGTLLTGRNSLQTASLQLNYQALYIQVIEHAQRIFADIIEKTKPTKFLKAHAKFIKDLEEQVHSISVKYTHQGLNEVLSQETINKLIESVSQDFNRLTIYVTRSLFFEASILHKFISLLLPLLSVGGASVSHGVQVINVLHIHIIKICRDVLKRWGGMCLPVQQYRIFIDAVTDNYEVLCLLNYFNRYGVEY